MSPNPGHVLNLPPEDVCSGRTEPREFALSILQEIQQEALDSQGDLGQILRKCKLLAAKLHSQPLADWLVWESNGYPEKVDVPPYRVHSLRVKGHFFGPMHSEYRNAPIPHALLPEEARSLYENHQIRDSIANLQWLVNNNEGGILTIDTSDLNMVLHDRVFHGHQCIQCWGELGVSAFVEILNSVRNRILDFAVELENEDADAGSPGHDPKIQHLQ